MPTVPLTNEDLTTGTLNGTGVFDILMKSTNEHLQEEFSKGRIKGAEYSQVYLGSMNAVMAQATQFLLQRDQASNQALLIEKQVELIELEKDKLALESQLVSKQILKMQQETVLLEAQVELMEQQLVTERANTTNITTGTIGKSQTKLTTENNNLQKQGSLLDTENLLVNQNRLNAIEQNTVIVNQADKIGAEKELLTQKRATEVAQTNGLDVTSDSVVGKQIALYQKQADGFDRDAEQKACKISLDAFAIQAANPDYPSTSVPTTIRGTNANPIFQQLNAGVKVYS